MEKVISDLPAWLQGISAVIALFLSTWAIIGQALAKRKERKQRAQAMAVSIYPELIFIQVSLERVKRVMSQYPFVEKTDLSLSNPLAGC